MREGQHLTAVQRRWMRNAEHGVTSGWNPTSAVRATLRELDEVRAENARLRAELSTALTSCEALEEILSRKAQHAPAH